MNIKIGILTLTGSDNYGNVLQNYALQEFLKDFHAEVETIENTTQYGRYLPHGKRESKLTFSYIKKYVYSQLNYRYNIKNTDNGIFKQAIYYKKNRLLMSQMKQQRKDGFRKFCENHINKADVCVNVNKIPFDRLQEYDYFVSGSDQVWNPTYPSTSMINFLQFAPEEKRIAFAPSFGIHEIPALLKAQYGRWLQTIPHLSVREERGQQIIKELTGRKADLICDPTLTLSQDRWEMIEEKPNFWKGEKYVLTYFLGNRNSGYRKYIDDIAKKNNLKVWHLFDIMEEETYAVSPQEFLFLIHHAELICTDSFHGTVFSIIFHKNFVSFPRVELGSAMSSRIDTLLKKFSLQEKDYRRIKETDVFNTDYSQVDAIIEKEQTIAKKFLGQAIGKEKMTVGRRKRVYTDKAECCGCNACALNCPVNCISMKQDEEGFCYPVIDETKCIACDQCHSVCPIEKVSFMETTINESFAGYSNKREVRESSSSGGIFTELAQIVLGEGGVVFGAGFDENFKVKHFGITKKEELVMLQGSKYVQSDIGYAYSEVREYLQSGRFVYFSGTPCQIKGLYAYLGKKTDPNLITQDIICHGVPSPKVWEKYVKSYEKRDVIQKISFRDKKYGWHYFSMAITLKRKEARKRLDEDWYLRLFLDNTILRPICYACPMKKEDSCADITLADCWSSSRVTKKIFDNDRGISLVFLHSKKGGEIWDKLCKSGKITTEKLDIDAALESQSAIRESAKMNAKRSMFFEALNQEEFEKLQKGWYDEKFLKKAKRKYIYYKTKVAFILLKRK